MRAPIWTPFHHALYGAATFAIAFLTTVAWAAHG